MPDLYLVVDLIVVIALLMLGATVLLKNKAVVLNRTFAYFVVCISFWIISNYVSNVISNPPRTAVIANYFVFSFSFAASVFLLRFVINLANDQKALRILRKAYIPYTLIAIASATPLVVANVELQEKVYAVIFGPVAPVYFVALIVNVVSSVYITKRNIKKASGVQKARLRVLFRSLYWTFPVLILFQAVIPVTTGWFGLTNIGVLPMLILVYGLYYGVVKHRLFDLRLIIVRSFAYVITIGFIAVFYSLTTHYATTLVTRGSNAVVGSLINILLIIIVVTAYAPLKEAFDKLTNKFFYRDAYDPQDLFDELNRTLVSSLDLNFLMDKSTAIIAQHLKSEFCLVGLKNDHDNARDYRLFGTQKVEFDPHDVNKARQITPRIHQSVIVADYLDQDYQLELQNIMHKNNIAVLVRLSSNVQKTEEGLGYIVLGTKKSGGPYTTQDIRVLSTVAKELIIAIQNALHFEEIQNFNLTLQQKVKDATHRLSESNKKLKAIDETKDDFIGMASHQLRTPLTSVKGYLSLVIEGDAGKITDMQRKLLSQAFISSQRMVFLIADLLNVSRLKTGKFIIERAPTNLADMVADEVEQLRETAEARELTIAYEQPKHFPTLNLDETKTRQVIMNFLDNAIYYTPTGGVITVALMDGPKSIELRIIDTGIGVPKHERYHLFTKFYRAKNAQKARPDGTGLGLFMAKKVIIAQGGSIIFDSKEGEGSTFGFNFPKVGELVSAPEQPTAK